MEAISFSQQKKNLPVYREMITGDGLLCLDIINGETVGKYFIKPEKEDEAKQQVNVTFNVESYLLGNPLRSAYVTGYPENLYVQGNEGVNRFYKALLKLNMLTNKLDEQESGNGVRVVLYPQYIVFDDKHNTLKLPIQTITEEDKRFTYEYLINTRAELNPQIIERLNRVYKDDEESIKVIEEFVESYAAFKDTTQKGFTLFSCNYYNELRYEYYTASLRTKAIINAIRLNPEQKEFTDYYRIMQVQRMQDKADVACIQYVYKGTYESIKFKEYLEQFRPDGVDGNIVDYFMSISNNICLREEQLKVCDGIEDLEPLRLFIYHYGNKSPNKDIEVMMAYESEETKRQSILKRIWLQHLIMKLGEESFENYLNIYTSGVIVPCKIQKKVWRWNTMVDLDTNTRDTTEIKVSEYRPRIK